MTRVPLKSTELAVFALRHVGKMSSEFRESMSGFVKTALLAGASSAVLPIAEVDDIAGFVLFKVFYKLYPASPARDIELALQKAIKTMRMLTKKDLARYFTEDEVDMLEGSFGSLRDGAFDDVKYWGAWICYSGR